MEDVSQVPVQKALENSLGISGLERGGSIWRNTNDYKCYNFSESLLNLKANSKCTPYFYDYDD